MFIGHLPAGYILTKVLREKMNTSKYLFLGILASVFPDVDILYFYFIDHRQNLHHGYWIHVPFYWSLIAAAVFLTVWVLNRKDYLTASLIFFSNIFLHLFLDTIVGKIEWLFPFSDKAIYFFDVPARYGFWVYNFVFHWTFLLEIMLLLWACIVYFKSEPLLL